MSDDLIQHDGDEIAQKVPMLGTFRQDLTDFGAELADALGQNKFAEGAKDELSLYAQSSFQKLMDAFGKIFTALGLAVGLQGDRLSVVNQIGNNTEGETTELGSSWPTSGGHHG